jgi:hypothetical protein
MKVDASLRTGLESLIQGLLGHLYCPLHYLLNALGTPVTPDARTGGVDRLWSSPCSPTEADTRS